MRLGQRQFFRRILAGSLGAAALVATASNRADDWSFRADILPILTKAGCNAGACHGAATGQEGFRLSLLGYDPEEDYFRITRERSGRRVDLSAPEQSLILRKGSGRVEHEGGRRLLSSSPEYRKLIGWIRAGAPFGPRDLEITSIEVQPVETVAAGRGETFPLRVVARHSDGSRRDVSTLALYTSNDDAVAEVTRTGEVIVQGSGATSIMVRYGGQVAASRVVMPYATEEGVAVKFPPRNFIDEHVGRELRRLRLPPSELSSPEEFIRRVYLDLAGRLPTPDEARRFLSEADSFPRREAEIERLLATDEFADFWTLKLADLLLVGGRRGNGEASRVYYDWLRKQVAKNRSLAGIVEDLLTATGSMRDVGPANFYQLAADPRDLAEHVGRMFLGTQIACARCHAHPADRWTQDDYHSFAAYFARVSRDGDLVRVSDRGEVDHPKTGEPMTPRPLGTRTANSTPEDRRVALAEWVTSRDNPFFARAMANRVWRELLGRGLVEPVDDLRPTNPATHPALIEALAERLVASGFDLRSLVRQIASSRAYQLTSRSNSANAQDQRFYSHALLKPLPAQVFVDAVAQVMGSFDDYEGYADGTRAVQLVDTQTASYALDVLGRCQRTGPCDTPGQRGGGLAQALHLINGSTINEKLAELPSRWVREGRSNSEIIEEIYLRAFSRFPDTDETAFWEKQLSANGERAAAVEDLFWVVLNSREFAFNH